MKQPSDGVKTQDNEMETQENEGAGEQEPAAEVAGAEAALDNAEEASPDATGEQERAAEHGNGEGDEDALTVLEAIDAEQREAGIFDVVQELEYVATPKTKGRKKKDAAAEDDVALQISNIGEARHIIEALLFATNEPLSVARISKLMNNLHPRSVRGLLLELQLDYESRGSGLQIVEIAGGFQMGTRPHLAEWVFRLHKHRRKNPLSPATLETLAIIAYKQPVTKAEVEVIRGVESGATIRTLLDFELIEIGGRREVLGRPQLYVTTPQFLKTFGLRSMSDLPSIHELKLMFANEQKLQAKTAAATEAATAEPSEETTPSTGEVVEDSDAAEGNADAVSSSSSETGTDSDTDTDTDTDGDSDTDTETADNSGPENATPIGEDEEAQERQ